MYSFSEIKHERNDHKTSLNMKITWCNGFEIKKYISVLLSVYHCCTLSKVS